MAARAARRAERLRPVPRLVAARSVRLGAGGTVVAGVENPGRHGAGALHARLADGSLHPLEATSVRWHAPSRPARERRFVVAAPAGAAAVVLECADGRRVETRLRPETPTGAVAAVRAALECGFGAPSRRALYGRVLGGPLEALWAARARPDGDGVTCAWRAELAVAHPDVTLVIPIYGRHDFIEHQLARFALDPYLARQDILYVIDDPRLHAVVRARADALARLYAVPFRVQFLPENRGYAGACNAGARAALAPRLLLLNSDVMPLAPGWLERLCAAARASGDRAVVGARLLYEDGSVQHDGMRLAPSPFHEGLWLNLHPGKGLPVSLFPVNDVPEPRDAVTGACLLIRADDYRALGGLDERYVLGDFEDSDLCLAAREAGLDVLIATDATLEHLERQSQTLVSDAPWKEELTRYNCWQHAMKWSAELEALAASRDAVADPTHQTDDELRRAA